MHLCCDSVTVGDGDCLGVRDPPDGPYKFIKYSEVRVHTLLLRISYIIPFLCVRLKTGLQLLDLVSSSWESSQGRKPL